MTLKFKLLAASAMLLLSAGAAAAVPATAETDLNVRSGPGTQYQVIGTIPGGETVDARNCTGSWCQVSFSGGSGWASRNYLAMGGVAPGPAVAVSPYVYDDDYYYDYGYAYGPSVGIYAGPRYWHGRRHGWHGRPGWNGRHGGWAGRPGRPGTGPQVTPGAGQGFAGPPAGWQRPGTGIGGGAAVSAPSGGGGGAAAAPAAPAGGGAQGGFAGSIVRGGR
jgi:uncharacterized protein YraI